MSTLLSPAPGEFGKPWGKGTVTWVYNSTADTSTKTFTPAAGKIWWVKAIYVNLTTTATVGNRIINIEALSGANVVHKIAFPTAQPASQTYLYAFSSAYSADTTASAFTYPFADVYLPFGTSLKVYDAAAIDAAADDMLVGLLYVEYDL